MPRRTRLRGLLAALVLAVVALWAAGGPVAHGRAHAHLADAHPAHGHPAHGHPAHGRPAHAPSSHAHKNGEHGEPEASHGRPPDGAHTHGVPAEGVPLDAVPPDAGHARGRSEPPGPTLHERDAHQHAHDHQALVAPPGSRGPGDGPFPTPLAAVTVRAPVLAPEPVVVRSAALRDRVLLARPDPGGGPPPTLRAPPVG